MKIIQVLLLRLFIIIITLILFINILIFIINLKIEFSFILYKDSNTFK